MAKNEQLKKNLRTADELPESMSWDTMHNGILSKVDSQTNSYKKDKKILYISLLLAFVTLSFFAFYLSQNSKAKVAESIDSIDTASKSPQINEPIVETSMSSNSKTNISKLAKDAYSNNHKSNTAETIVKTTEFKNSISIQKAYDSTEQIAKQKVEQAITMSSNTKSSPTKGYISSRDSQNSVLNKSSFNTGNRQPSKSIVNSEIALQASQMQKREAIPHSSELQVEKTNQEHKNILHADVQSNRTDFYLSPNLLAKKYFIASKNYPTLQPKLTKPNGPTQTINSIDNPWAIEFGLGAHVFNPNFAGSELAEAKASFNNAFIGYAGEFLLKYSLSPNWQIGSGISYQNLVSELDYFNSTYSVENQEVLTLIEVSLLSQDSTFHYTNKDVSTLNWRRVLHYNTSKVFSIPILFERNWNLNNKWKWTTGLGTQMNIWSRSQGKAIISDQGELSTYEIVDYENDFYSINGNFNILLNSGLKYAFNEHMYLGMDLRGSMALQNWSTDLAYSSKPIVFSSNFKIGYQF